MRVLLSSALLSAVLATSVVAQGVELWRGLTVGMTKAQAKAVMPEDDFYLFDGCRVVVAMRHPKDRLERVIIRPKYSAQKTPCAAAISKTLYEKYGEPTRDTFSIGAIGKMVPAKDFNVYVWESNGVAIEYHEQIDGNHWSLTYRLPYAETEVPTVEGL